MKGVIEECQPLMARIKPLLDEIDLKRDMTETVRMAILLGTYPGIVPGELAKKLVVLQYQGKITNTELTTILSNPKQLFN